MTIPKITSANNYTLLLLVAACLIALAVFGRVLPHPPNFTPLAAIAIFGGALLPRRWALTLPLASMIISDLIIGLHPLFILTWGTFALIAFLSNRLLTKVKLSLIIGASVGASLLFFIVTNFGVWLQGKMYAMTFTGLIECYYQAIPFFRNTLLGDLLFTAMLFGIYACVRWLVSQRRTMVAGSITTP
jgi:hypothetical protein